MLELEKCVTELAKREELKLVIITGDADIFVAGGDIKDLASITDREAAESMSRQMNDVLLCLEQLDCITVAAINGNAIGGGCELALACDLRVMSETAHLHFKQVFMGVTPGWGGGQRLARLVGAGKAAYLYGLGVSLSANEALQHGVVDFVEADVKVRIEELRQSTRIVPPQALRSTKHAIRQGALLEPADAYSLERSLFAKSWISVEHETAVQKFLNRKK